MSRTEIAFEGGHHPEAVSYKRSLPGATTGVKRGGDWVRLRVGGVRLLVSDLAMRPTLATVPRPLQAPTRHPPRRPGLALAVGAGVGVAVRARVRREALAVVGLGNVGAQYVGTRHNVGFAALDEAASHLVEQGWQVDGGIWQPRCGGNLLQLRKLSEELLLFKPASMMNGSGGPVSELVEDFKLKDQELVVVYDDLDLEVGRLRLRKSGSCGGQTGVRSILSRGLQDFLRMRVGISRPKQSGRGGVVGHVLGRFTPDEAEKSQGALRRVSEAVQDLAEGMSTDNVMNKFNRPLVTQIS